MILDAFNPRISQASVYVVSSRPARVHDETLSQKETSTEQNKNLLSNCTKIILYKYLKS